MNPLDKTPGTRIYRENREVIELEAERLFKDFENDFNGNIEVMFGIDNAEQSLSEGEKEDLLNFAKYATKRLGISAAASPAHQMLMNVGGAKETIQAKVLGGSYVGHDVLHAAVAYARSNGSTLRPAFDLAQSTEAKIDDPVALGEEMIVLLLREVGGKSLHRESDIEPFIVSIMKGGDPVQWFRRNRGGISPEQEERIRTLSPLREIDPLEYYAHMHEEEWNNGNDANLPYDFLRTSNDSAYKSLLAALHTNFQQGTPDPKIGVHEFQRMVAPLLERLRTKDSAA